MNQLIKIALIGGTGKSGKYLVDQLITQGFQLKLLLRNPEHFPIKNPLIEIVVGDARDDKAIQSLLEGCQAVISTLGQPKGESSIFSTATANVLKAMKDLGIDRYIVTTGLSVNTHADSKNPKAKYATDWMYEHYPETMKDKQVEYDLLSTSTINWTMVRLPLIEQTNERCELEVNLSDCPGDKVSAMSLAHFLAGQLFSNDYIKQAPFIANR